MDVYFIREIYQMHYEICWVGKDGLYGCGHEHPSVADAVRHMVPESGCFIRACESGVFRSLNETEVGYFLVALRQMPWRSPALGQVEEAAGTG
jgi:hypothetical protein